MSLRDGRDVTANGRNGSKADARPRNSLLLVGGNGGPCKSAQPARQSAIIQGEYCWGLVERPGGQTRTIFPRPHLSRHSRSDRRAAGSAYHHPPSWQVEDVRPGARPDAYPPGANALPYSWSFTDLNSFRSRPARRLPTTSPPKTNRLLSRWWVVQVPARARPRRPAAPHPLRPEPPCGRRRVARAGRRIARALAAS